MDHGYTYVNAQLDIFYLPEAHEMMSLKDKIARPKRHRRRKCRRVSRLWRIQVAG